MDQYRQIALVSLFRNSIHNLPHYFARVRALADHLRHMDVNVRVVAVEGDSTDGTDKLLKTYREVQLVKFNHGGPVYGSTEEPARLKALSGCINAGFNAVSTQDDVVVYVESDLQWDAHTIGSLIDMAWRHDEGFDIFAPMVWAHKAFYDIWGFRAHRDDGEVTRFAPHKPFHPAIRNGLTPLHSAGSCLAMTRKVATSVRIRNDYAIVGWCQEANMKGFRIALAPGFGVRQA